MYLIGHLGFLLCANFLIEKIRGNIGNHNKIILGIGSMIPDLIDKPIGSLIFHNGRWIGHSIFVLTGLLLLGLFVINIGNFKKYPYRLNLILLYVSSLAHLLLDLPGLSYKVAFWPIFGSFPPGTRYGFLLGYQHTPTIVSEIIGFCFILYIGKYENWDKTKWLAFAFLMFAYLTLYIVMYALFVGL